MAIQNPDNARSDLAHIVTVKYELSKAVT